MPPLRGRSAIGRFLPVVTGRSRPIAVIGQWARHTLQRIDSFSGGGGLKGVEPSLSAWEAHNEVIEKE